MNTELLLTVKSNMIALCVATYECYHPCLYMYCMRMLAECRDDNVRILLHTLYSTGLPMLPRSLW